MDFAEFWRASLLQNISSRSFLDNPYTFSTLFCCLCLCSYQGAPRDHAGKYMFSEPPQVLVHTYERVMNVCFSENATWFFLVTPVLKFSLLSYWRRNINRFLIKIHCVNIVHIRTEFGYLLLKYSAKIVNGLKQNAPYEYL